MKNALKLIGKIALIVFLLLLIRSKVINKVHELAEKETIYNTQFGKFVVYNTYNPSIGMGSTNCIGKDYELFDYFYAISHTLHICNGNLLRSYTLDDLNDL